MELRKKLELLKAAENIRIENRGEDVYFAIWTNYVARIELLKNGEINIQYYHEIIDTKEADEDLYSINIEELYYLKNFINILVKDGE